MKKITKATLAGAAAVALAATGSTFAQWSDYAVDEGQNVGAGHLTLNVNDESGNGPKSQFDNLKLAPGQGKDEYTLITSNDGDSVPNGTLSAKILDLTNAENGCENNAETDAESGACAGEPGEFSDNAMFKMTAYRVSGPNVDCGNNVAGGGEYSGNGVGKYTAFASQTLTAAAAAGEKKFTFGGGGSDMVLAPGDSLCVGASIVLPSGAGNNTQGDSSSFDIRYDLVQTSAAKDANAA